MACSVSSALSCDLYSLHFLTSLSIIDGRWETLDELVMVLLWMECGLIHMTLVTLVHCLTKRSMGPQLREYSTTVVLKRLLINIPFAER